MSLSITHISSRQRKRVNELVQHPTDGYHMQQAMQEILDKYQHKLPTVVDDLHDILYGGHINEE